MAFLSLRDFIYVMAVVLTWGAHTTIIKFGLQEVDPLLLNTMRYFLTGLVFMPFIRKWDWSYVPILMMVGLFFYACNMGGMQLALDRLNVASVVFLAMLAIPVMILVDWLVFGKKFGLYTTLGIVLAFAGIVVIYGAPDIAGAPIGVLFMAISVGGWVTGSFLMRKTERVDFGFFCFITGLSGGVITLVASLMVEDNQMGQLLNADWAVLGGVLAYQVLILSVVTYCWRIVMQNNPAEVVTPLLLLQIPLAITLAAMALGESLASQAWIGGGMILGGVAFIQLRRLYLYYCGAGQ